jgi:hypothetical protein
MARRTAVTALKAAGRHHNKHGMEIRVRARPHLAPRGLRPRAFAEAYSGATAVYFYKFYAGQLKRPSKHRKGRMTRFRCFTLK